MIKKIKILLAIFLCILSIGCREDSTALITIIEINSQSDIDIICNKLSDSDTFIGNIIVITEDELDYKCLRKLRHIQGALLLDAPRVSNAFRDIETVIGGEVFSICDEAVDTIYFPKLKIVDTDIGISISSDCNFFNVLHIPNIETLTSISIGSPLIDQARSGTFLGFDMVEEMETIRLDNGYQDDNFKIDGFSRLKKIKSILQLYAINESFQVSDKSFNNLEEVGIFRVHQTYDSESELSLEYLFPRLRSSEKMSLIYFDPEEVCYLKDYIKSGDIEIVYFESSTNVNYDVESLLVLCE